MSSEEKSIAALVSEPSIGVSGIIQAAVHEHIDACNNPMYSQDMKTAVSCRIRNVMHILNLTEQFQAALIAKKASTYEMEWKEVSTPRYIVGMSNGEPLSEAVMFSELTDAAKTFEEEFEGIGPSMGYAWVENYPREEDNEIMLVKAIIHYQVIGHYKP